MSLSGAGSDAGELTFPPLLSGVAVHGPEDPFEKACALAALGCDAGTVVYNLSANNVAAAIVFAPEVGREDAMAMLPLCGVGLQNALGALAPPEVAVHLAWDGGIRVNGADCGRFRVAAADSQSDDAPDWLVVGWTIPLMMTLDPGENPGITALYEEGCADVDAGQLVESWARHALVWINRWTEAGNRPLHAEWLGLVPDVGEDIRILGRSGTFVGTDDRFGMLLREGTKTNVIALSALLGDTP